MKKNITYFLIAFLPALIFGQTNSCKTAQGCSLTNSISLTTGIDENGNQISPAIGAVDPHWTLINNPPLILNNTCTSLLGSINGSAYVVNHNNLSQNSWVNQTGSSTLGPADGGGDFNFGCNNQFNQENDRIPYIFQREICICKPDSFNFNFSYKGDDEVFFQLINTDLNNLPIFTTPVGQQTPDPETFNQTFWLPPGHYAFRANLINIGRTTLGFSVIGNVSSTSNNNYLLQDLNCCTSNTLTVTKVLDNNCDGINNNGDLVGANWTFDLIDNNDNNIQTGITDVNGNLIFNNIPSGNYLIQEHTLPGWAPNQPLGGIQQIQINSGINQATFFNCPTTGQYCCPGVNLIENGNFEGGNSNVNSDYDFIPANNLSNFWVDNYSIVNASQATSISSQWVVDDHSTPCDGNGNFLVVNGQTGENADKRVWYQENISVEENKKYSFCFHSSNLPQCSFDVEPTFYVRTYPKSVKMVESTCSDYSNDCGWQEHAWRVEIPSGVSNITIEIWLNEQVIGDGNDLAIDDISLQELIVPPLSFSDFDIEMTTPSNGQYNMSATAVLPLPNGYNAAWVIGTCNEEGTIFQNIPIIDHWMYGNLQNAIFWDTDHTNFAGYDGSSNSYSNNNIPGFCVTDQISPNKEYLEMSNTEITGTLSKISRKKNSIKLKEVPIDKNKKRKNN